MDKENKQPNEEPQISAGGCFGIILIVGGLCMACYCIKVLLF